MSTSPSRVNSFDEMLKGYLELGKTLFLTNINLFVSVGDEKKVYQIKIYNCFIYLLHQKILLCKVQLFLI